MWRYLLSFALVVGAGLFILSSQHHDSTNPGPKVYNTKQELTSKQSLLAQDVNITDDLCRSQCSLDYVNMLNRIESGNPPQQVLTEMKKQHEKMNVLIWSKHDQLIDQGVTVGEIPAPYTKTALTYIKEAKAAVVTGVTYQSPRFGNGKQIYFVIGVPSTQGNSSLIGVIHQDILHHVENHQRKNLRLEPYPSENRWKVESVDTDTLNDKVVDHPEDNQGTSHYQKNEVVVRFKQEPTQAQLEQIKKEIGSQSVRKVGYTYVFQTDKMDAKPLMAYFQKWDVQYAEPHFLYLTNEATPSNSYQYQGTDSSIKADHVTSKGNSSEPVHRSMDPFEPYKENNTVTPSFIPNDLLFSRYQWNLPVIETMEGWQVNRGAQDVIVAVVDTGVDLNHPDLVGQLLPGYNAVSENDQPNDDVGHGTHVTGVIAAAVNNNLGVAGMTWFNKVLPVKVLDQTGAGSTYAVAQGIIWAADHGAKVINMSLGNYADSEFLHDAVKYAYDKDIVLVAASGNDNTERPGFPAAYPEVLAVAATDANNEKASFSNYGDYIDVAAPGVSIASTYPDSQYAALSGTSMASPHVTALAALIRSTNPLLTNEQVYDLIRKSATDLGDKGKDNYFGYGLIDVVKAVKAAEQSKSTASTTWPDFTARKFAELLRGRINYSQARLP